MRTHFGLAAAIAASVLGGLHAVPIAQRTRSVWDGVYTEAQAARGAALYDAECASCHGAAGQGGSAAPDLAGPAFSANYDGQSVQDLFDRNLVTMPPGREGQLSRQQNADITAYMLQVNRFPPGPDDLPTSGQELRQIGYVASAPEGSRPADVHQDDTPGEEWIRRLDRPDRLPGLRIDDVIACLKLAPGDIVADIGAGTGAFSIPFAQAIGPTGEVLAADIHQALLDRIAEKAAAAEVTNLRTVLARLDDPGLPRHDVDLAFFHDVFHNVNDRPGYLKTLAAQLAPAARIAIVEQEFDDPIARNWDRPEDRITREQVKEWMAGAGFSLLAECDLFLGPNNPAGAGMPERWFVIYERTASGTSQK